MPVELRGVGLEEKAVLWRLIQLYLHDCTEFDPFDIGSDGRFKWRWFDAYFEESSRHPFFIGYGDRLAGFVLVRDGNGKEDWDFQIAEFFILRRYRRMGVGKTAATRALSLYPGKWEISFNDANAAAVGFWRSVVSQFGPAKPQPEPGYEGRSRYLIAI